ncbi:MAG: proton-conducting transporter membrane subunit [Lachnospiraceae bacterium]|nr:proton-conducting transporter membrane subunit [Lachnospiraceae bacterium]
MNQWITMLPICVPVLAALLSIGIRSFEKDTFRKGYVTATLSVTLLLMLLAAVCGGRVEYTIIDGLTFVFRPDGIGRFFGLLSAGMWLLAGIYSFQYMHHEERCINFYRYYMITIGAICGIALSGSYLSLYLTFEAMSFASFPMVMNSRTKQSVNAAMKYLFYSVAGSALGLVGFFFLSVYTTTTEFVAGGSLDLSAVAGSETKLLVVLLLVIIGFGTKAGMFPMHAWLPTAHPAAPSPASAVMSGIITKAGILAIIRVVFFVAGADAIRGTWLQKVWMILALITVFMGSMLAYKENILKKRLAYSSVSQLSYVMLGLSTLTAAGFTGAVLHMAAHAVIKDLLFMCAGCIIMKTSCTRVDELRGIGKRMPGTMICFTIASLGLVGIPPTAGFVSKWYLAQGALESGCGVLGIVGPAVLLVSALLTAGYLLTVSVSAFLPGADFDRTRVVKCEAPVSMLWPMALLALAVFAIGMAAAPLIDFASAVAQTIL